jgi:predicted NACHT family NTPase
MPVQPRRLSEASITILKQVLKKTTWTQAELAAELQVSRSTISQLLAGQPVRVETIEELCHLLEIDVGQFIQPIAFPDDIELLVQQLRSQVAAGIEQLCGMMRILDMSQPVDAEKIYTAVNILEQITSKTGRNLDDLMENCGPEEFDRFLLGKVREQRVSALEAVKREKKLMIFGKPGSGKTTFLKRLATMCRKRTFLAQQVPIFVTLKEWAESSREPKLLEFISRTFSISINSLEAILRAGRGLVLLDGLDEVLEKDEKRILEEIVEFTRNYEENYT